jgi:hypothetical protein
VSAFADKFELRKPGNRFGIEQENRIAQAGVLPERLLDICENFPSPNHVMRQRRRAKSGFTDEP